MRESFLEHFQASRGALAMGSACLLNRATGRVQRRRALKMRSGVFEPDQAVIVQMGENAGEGASQFTKRWLKGADSGAVVAFPSPEKPRFLGNTKLAGMVVTNANYLVYSEYGVLSSADAFDSFIATVENLVAHLLRNRRERGWPKKTVAG